MTQFKRKLEKDEILAAISEWCHRRGHKVDIEKGIEMSFDTMKPNSTFMVVTVETVDAYDPNLRYEVKRAVS